MSKFFKVNKAEKEQKGTYVVYLDGAEWCTRNTKEEAEAVVNSYDINAIDDGLVDPKQIAKDLAQYISEEMCEDFCRIYEIKDISELE